jgi:hypothetical protein
MNRALELEVTVTDSDARPGTSLRPRPLPTVTVAAAAGTRTVTVTASHITAPCGQPEWRLDSAASHGRSALVTETERFRRSRRVQAVTGGSDCGTAAAAGNGPA